MDPRLDRRYARMLTPAWAIALHAGEFAEDQNTFTECTNGGASIGREFSVLSRHAIAFSFGSGISSARTMRNGIFTPGM